MNESSGNRIRTSLSPQGVPSVVHQIPVEDNEPITLMYTPDAAVEVALSLLAAAYAARAEQALFTIGNQQSLSVEDLIKWMRGPGK